MKKIAFAWVTVWYHFDTEEEAIKYIDDNQGKGWKFEKLLDKVRYIGDGKWEVRVCRPYGKYNPGW